MELISVIVPVYKVEAYLENCLNSVCAQTYRNLEIILVDDGSPDNCGAICEEYAKRDNRIQVIHKQNAGLGMARNSGLEVATGKYVVFVDSDDWMDTDMVEKLVSAAQEQSADMVICGYHMVPQNGASTERPVCKTLERYEGSEQIVQEILAPIIGPKWVNGVEDVQEMCVWTNLYSMDIIRKYNLRFVTEREYLSEDFFFNISYITKTKTIVRIPEQLYSYRFNDTSLSNTFRANRMNLLNNLIGRGIELLRDEGVYELLADRLKRTYIKKVRHGLFHVSQANITPKEKRMQYEQTVHCEMLRTVLSDYPKCEVPARERILVALLEKQQVTLTRIYLELQLLVNGLRKRIKALKK